MNNRQKGLRHEKEVEDLFKAKNWQTFRPSAMGWSKWTKNKDIFLFDILAIQGRAKVWIQVKTKTCPKKVRDDIEAWSKEHCIPKYESCEIWIRLPMKNWKVIRFSEN